MRMGRWRGRLDKEMTERGWHCVSCELITERGLAVGTAALQMFVGAFRSPERQEEMKGGGGGVRRGKEITEQGQNELIINMIYVYIMKHFYLR